MLMTEDHTLRTTLYMYNTCYFKNIFIGLPRYVNMKKNIWEASQKSYNWEVYGLKLACSGG